MGPEPVIIPTPLQTEPVWDGGGRETSVYEIHISKDFPEGWCGTQPQVAPATLHAGGQALVQSPLT